MNSGSDTYKSYHCLKECNENCQTNAYMKIALTDFLSHYFLYLKIVKIHFHVVLPSVHSNLQNTSILGKSYRFGQSIILF